MMKRFIIHVETNWCGMWADYAAYAEKESDLDELAQQLAYANFEMFSLEDAIAESNGYNPEEMTDGDWDRLWQDVNESDYYRYTIEEFDEVNDTWEYYELVTDEEGKCI